MGAHWNLVGKREYEESGYMGAGLPSNLIASSVGRVLAGSVGCVVVSGFWLESLGADLTLMKMCFSSSLNIAIDTHWPPDRAHGKHKLRLYKSMHESSKQFKHHYA